MKGAGRGNSINCTQVLNNSSAGSVLQRVLSLAHAAGNKGNNPWLSVIDLFLIDLHVFVIISVSSSQQGTAGHVETRGYVWRGRRGPGVLCKAHRSDWGQFPLCLKLDFCLLIFNFLPYFAALCCLPSISHLSEDFCVQRIATCFGFATDLRHVMMFFLARSWVSVCALSEKHLWRVYTFSCVHSAIRRNADCQWCSKPNLFYLKYKEQFRSITGHIIEMTEFKF